MKRSVKYILALAITATALPVQKVSAADGNDVAAGVIGGLVAGWLLRGANDNRRSDRIEYNDGSYDRIEGLNEGRIVHHDGYVEYDRCQTVRVENCDPYGRIYESTEVYCVLDNGQTVKVRGGLEYFEPYQRRQVRQVRRERSYERPQINIQIDARRNHRNVDYYRPAPLPPPVIYPQQQQQYDPYQQYNQAPGVLPMDQPPGVLPWATR